MDYKMTAGCICLNCGGKVESLAIAVPELQRHVAWQGVTCPSCGTSHTITLDRITCEGGVIREEAKPEGEAK